MNAESERIVREGLAEAFKLTVENLFRVYGAPGNPDHDEAFMRGLEKCTADYEHMIELVRKQRKLV